MSPKPGTRRECGSWSPCASHTPLEKQHVPVERLLERRAWSLGLRSTIPQCVERGHEPVEMQEAHVHVLRTLVERSCAPSDVMGGGEDLHVGEREREEQLRLLRVGDEGRRSPWKGGREREEQQ